VSVRQKKNNDEESVSEQEIWSTIRYLDPDTKAEASNVAATVTFIAFSRFAWLVLCFTFPDCEMNANRVLGESLLQKRNIKKEKCDVRCPSSYNPTSSVAAIYARNGY
jgi:hypothetical protein